MARRSLHYESAFEEYLRANRIPYVAVDEARKALLPGESGVAAAVAIKSFDFVVYRPHAPNIIVDIKGRRVPRRLNSGAAGRLESWVTQEDVHALQQWEGLFGAGFGAAFVFVYWCESQPPDALFDDVFTHRGRWYAPTLVTLRDYAASMRPRSPRWGTVDLPGRTFEAIHEPLWRFIGTGGPGLPVPAARSA
ncbi:MAG: HYExAFE family protein [Phycisphaeraceae bacterium]|nr:HYExAFE family protein [Phycisphaeraceae bacterium]